MGDRATRAPAVQAQDLATEDPTAVRLASQIEDQVPARVATPAANRVAAQARRMIVAGPAAAPASAAADR